MNKVVELTPAQFLMVQYCIESISANERRFSEESEKSLKEISEIFNAEYIPDANIGEE